MQQRRQLRKGRVIQLAAHVVGNTTLDTLQFVESAIAGNVGRLARPGRDGAKARHTEEQPATGLLYRHAGPVLEQALEHLLLVAIERLTQLGEMRELGVQPGYRRHFAGQLLKQFAVAEGGKSGCAAQDQHRDSLCKKGCGRPGSNDQSTPIKRRERTLHHACVEGRVF